MMNKTSQTSRGSWWFRIWDAIIRPHPSVTDVGDYHRARLFAGITFLLSISIASALIILARPTSNSEVARSINVLLALEIGTILSYVLSRTRYFMAGVAIVLAALSTGGYMLVFLGSDNPRGSILIILPVAFLIGMVMLDIWGNFILGMANVLFPLALPLLVPDSFDFALVGPVSGLALFLTALAVLNAILRERIESDRLAETREMNIQLQEASVNLEQRVADRTRDLALASELGRRISLVRDMDTLLADTVDLIQEHFNLYYTQIYLVDQSMRSLILKAGYGETGKEMLRRSHRLPIDFTSNNGAAVMDRRTVVVPDTQSSPTFRPHELLPDTRSEMCIPLISAERVLGVIDLQSNQTGALTTDNQAVFETIAAQLAIALVNVDLFGQVQRSLTELEARSRKNVFEGWQAYLDGIEVKEHFGYTYDEGNVVPLEKKLAETADAGELTAPMQVSGAPIGKIQLVADRSWSPEDLETVQAVSNMVAQQIENLRLLDQAEQYRRDAEEAVRRLSRQEWSEFVEKNQGAEMAYVYTGAQVQAIETGQNGHVDGLSFDIKVQDEAIGEFDLDGVNHLTAEEEEILQAVSNQLGAHLENLRLYAASQQELVERRRTEEALRASEADLSNALRLAHMGNWELDLSTMLFTFNDDFYAMLHTTAEAEGGYYLTPEQYGKYVHPDDVHLMADETRKAIETTDPNYISQVEHRFFYADGGTGYLSVLITVEKDENGKTIKTRGVNQDITERRRAEDALRKSEKDLSDALRLARMGYWEFDLNTMLFTFNDDFYAILHTTAEAEGGYHLTPEQYGKFIHPDDLYLMLDGSRSASETMDPNFTQNIEHRCLYADGGMGYMNVMVTVELDDTGRVIKTRGVNQDITERRRFQDMLSKRAGELATVAEISTKVTTIQDPDEMLQTVVDLAKPAFNLYHAHIYLLDEAGDTLVLTKGAGEIGQKIVAEGRQIPLDAEKSLVARAARTLEGVTVNDVRQDPDFLPHPLLPETRSEMAIPVISSGKLLGVLDVQSEEVGKFTEEDVSIQTTLASQIGSHLESIRLFASVQRELVERQRAQEALRRSEASLSEALRIARMGNWEYDIASDEFITNDQIYAVFRTTAEAEGGYHMPAQKFMEKFVHPEDVSIVSRQIASAIQSATPADVHGIEYRWIYGDGEVGYISTLIQSEKDENGKTIKAYGTSQDITERKRADIALEEQRRTLQVILNNMPVAVLAKDAKTYEFVMWNQAAEELFGMKSEDVIGKTDYDFYPKEQADAFRAADIEVVRDRKRINIPEEAANNAKGETRILQTVKVPVVDENDQPVLLLVVTADVTEVKQAQDTIAKRARELEKVASVSTSVSTIQTPDEMLQTVVDLTKESFDLYHAHIYLFDEAEKMLVLTKGAGEVGRQMVAEGRKIALGAEKSLVARAARSRQGVTVNDVRQDPDFLPHPLLPETRSEMAVPMIAGDRLLGVIDVQDEEVGRFSQEDINILTTLAAQVAISLQNARSYARAQRQAEREALINIISERIQATNSVETALQVAVREIGRALGAQHTAIRLGLERKNTDQS
jgi:PAS domain S-box-containing protein